MDEVGRMVEMFDVKVAHHRPRHMTFPQQQQQYPQQQQQQRQQQQIHRKSQESHIAFTNYSVAKFSDNASYQQPSANQKQAQDQNRHQEQKDPETSTKHSHVAFFTDTYKSKSLPHERKHPEGVVPVTAGSLTARNLSTDSVNVPSRPPSVAAPATDTPWTWSSSVHTASRTTLGSRDCPLVTSLAPISKETSEAIEAVRFIAAHLKNEDEYGEVSLVK